MQMELDDDATPEYSSSFNYEYSSKDTGDLFYLLCTAIYISVTGEKWNEIDRIVDFIKSYARGRRYK